MLVEVTAAARCRTEVAENEEHFIPISVKQKPCLCLPVVPNSPDHGDVGKIIEAIVGINECNYFGLISHL